MINAILPIIVDVKGGTVIINMAIGHGVWLGLSSHSAIDHEFSPYYNVIKKLGHLQPKRNIVQTITYAL